MEEIKIILPVFAIILSIIALYLNKRNIKRQLRIGKLEEILENVLYLSNFYTQLLILSTDLKDINEKKLNNENVEINEKQFREEIERFKNVIDKNKIQQVVSRTSVLTNAYLPNGSLKNRILTFNHLLSIMFGSVMSEAYYILEQNYKEGIPRRKKIGEFIIKIENDLIKEMNLGFSSLKNESFKKYREDIFKKEMGLIE
ncbi:MAG: hypothetical protein H7Y10_14800 [Flavobacterium sp.]|nr:hypothetical protein [Flavobacterium sp.]